MAEGPSKLRGTTKPDVGYVGNDSGAIGSTVIALQLQIGDWLGSLDP